jgi:hypothetical protein
MSGSFASILNESIPSTNTLKGLTETLIQWRSMLPKELQWAEDDPAAFPASHTPPTTEFEIASDPDLS